MSDEEERGGAFYDVPATFERYTAGRGPDASDPAWVMEEPAFLAALGDVRGARESTDEPRGAWVVDDYFARGPRPQVWLDASSPGTTARLRTTSLRCSARVSASTH